MREGRFQEMERDDVYRDRSRFSVAVGWDPV